MTAAPLPPAFLQAVVDTLLPGDGALPGGNAVGVALDGARHAATLQAIAAAAGGAETFVSAAPSQRAAIVASVEARDAPALRGLLMPLLQAYFDSTPVMDALGWPARPPQPQGHALPPTDAETWRRLDKVRMRAKIWRDAR